MLFYLSKEERGNRVELQVGAVATQGANRSARLLDPGMALAVAVLEEERGW
jgi:hypothetical protein